MFADLEVPGIRDIYHDQPSSTKRLMLHQSILNLSVQRKVIDETIEKMEKELKENEVEKSWLSKGVLEPSGKIDEAVAAGEQDSVTSPSSPGVFSGFDSDGPDLTIFSDDAEEKGKGSRIG